MGGARRADFLPKLHAMPGVDTVELGRKFMAVGAYAVTRPHPTAPNKVRRARVRVCRVGPQPHVRRALGPPAWTGTCTAACVREVTCAGACWDQPAFLGSSPAITRSAAPCARSCR
jgi:hypothetical protein